MWHRSASAWREQLMSVLRRTAEIAALAQRGAEAAFLVRLLTAHHLGRLAARLPPDTQQVRGATRVQRLKGSAQPPQCCRPLSSSAMPRRLACRPWALLSATLVVPQNTGPSVGL